MSEISLITGNCLEELKKLKDHTIDIIFTDPPYGLGSEVIIRPDGKPDYDKASDFMSKWDMPTGIFWEEWYKEAFRVLKHGGYCLIFGMDRQLLLSKYYAHLAKFSERQSIYWFFISNFPKASDLSKNLDKNAGADREVVGKGVMGRNLKRNGHKGDMAIDEVHQEPTEPEITIATTPLAKKYSGYKYSISPLKQTNETIMVFQKPYKTGSCMHDTLAYENGDKECCCGALDIDGTRCATNETLVHGGKLKTLEGDDRKGKALGMLSDETENKFEQNQLGRFPAQTFVECICDKVIEGKKGEPIVRKNQNTSTLLEKGFEGKPKDILSQGKDTGAIHTNLNCPCAILDRQSGSSKSAGGKSGHTGAYQGGYKEEYYEGVKPGFGDTGGCSKILHKCKFNEEEHDLYFYCPKVSRGERNDGLGEDIPDKPAGARMKSDSFTTENMGNTPASKRLPEKNNHPTVKPISLIVRVLSLFKTPNPQVVLDPFLGSGSTGIACVKLKRDFIGVEINPDYMQIAKQRIGKAQEDEKGQLF